MQIWDDLIDEAARRLTAGEPTAGFKARVMARVDEGPPARWSCAWLAVPAIAVAIVALTIVAPRERATDQRLPQVSSQVGNAPATGDIEPPPRVVTKAIAPPPQPPRTIAAAGRVPDLPPDVALEAIAIAPVELAPMDVEALAAAPAIALDAISVEPLEIVNSGQ